MRVISIAGCLACLLFVPAPGFVEMSVAWAETRASEALLLNCRKAVFRKYGWRIGGGKLGLPPAFVARQVDLCVANRGQVR